MILFAPELEPKNSPAKVATGATKLPRSQSVPTARTLTKFLNEAQATVRLKGQVTVLLTTNKEIRRLNREFRGKDKATDVLSFPAMAMPGLKASEQMAGDLAISVPTALKQSTGQGHSLGTELKVLMLHGLLHLAGYDHEDDEGQMARREAALRAKLGLPLGLIERVEGKAPAKKAAAKPASVPAKQAKALPKPATPKKKTARSRP